MTPKGNENPPVDYESPVTINFLIIKDTTFKFIIGVKEKDNIDIELKDKDNQIIKIIHNEKDFELKGQILKITNILLEKALKEHGIGAKTAVGYGYMK